MGLWSWLRGVSEPDTGGTSAPSLPSGGEPSGRDAAAPASDPGMARASARAADPRRRCALRRPARRLRREPRHLAEPAHADRAGARAGAVGAVGVGRGDRRRDARPARRRGAPGGRGTAVAADDAVAAGIRDGTGAARGAVRPAREDGPADGRCRQRASRVPTGSLPVRCSARRPSCSGRRDRRRRRVRPACRRWRRRHRRLRRRVSGRRPWGCRRPARRRPSQLALCRHRPDRRPVIPPWATPVPRHPTRWRRPSTVRRSPNAPSRTRIPAVRFSAPHRCRARSPSLRRCCSGRSTPRAARCPSCRSWRTRHRSDRSSPPRRLRRRDRHCPSSRSGTASCSGRSGR